jgi:hypothetical protein
LIVSILGGALILFGVWMVNKSNRLIRKPIKEVITS